MAGPLSGDTRSPALNSGQEQAVCGRDTAGAQGNSLIPTPSESTTPGFYSEKESFVLSEE